MVRAWYMEGDGLVHPKDEHQRLPPKFITLEDLHRITGVEHQALNVDTYNTDGSWDKIKEDGGYNFENIFETPEGEELTECYQEHLYENEEIRFVLQGCGYYDIRDNDEWIRIEVVSGDLIVIPGGCYQRFMLDRTNKFRAKRLFKKGPQHIAYKRPADEMDCRQEYLKKLENGTFET